ncbi:MAG: hypothetical protein ACOYL3_21840 [Desulfuromonadaceae bacterium]
MNLNEERLFRLLPAIYRLRDTDAMGAQADNPTPEALRELIGVIADQVAVLEEELEQLYDNLFVETAAPWALPYLADLLGLRGLGATGLDKRVAPRAEVANTIACRRRKGTAAMLEQLARDIMDRPAAAVEYWQHLATTQHVNHVRRGNITWASVRDARRLEFIGTPFETAARSVEVRRIEPGLGKWNIPNVGLFVWRLQDHSRTRSPLVPAGIPDKSDVRHYRLHPLGLDMPLCARPETETDIAHLAEPGNVPLLLSWRQFAGKPACGSNNRFHPGEEWYGPNRSVQLWRIRNGMWEPIPVDKIIVCDLHDIVEGGTVSRWGHDNSPFVMTGDMILLDSVRGRVMLPEAEEIYATFCTLFPADIGGGEYARTATFDRSSCQVFPVARQPAATVQPNAYGSIEAALNDHKNGDTIIQVCDSGIYAESLPALTACSRTIELRAQDGCWPVLVLDTVLELPGDEAGQVTLNGFLISGNAIEICQGPGLLRVRHCTLMQGLMINDAGRVDVNATRDPVLTIDAGMTVELENCILGPLHVAPDTVVRIRNCIVDAGAMSTMAISGGNWKIENCTIIGSVDIRGLELAGNTIFYGDSVTVAHRQEGCVRFCWLPGAAAVPRRYKCVPRIDEDGPGSPVSINGVPQFVSTRFGDAAFCQLSCSCPDAIRRGADDESEMGVYHDLLEPRREAHLRYRLSDYLRFGLEAGILYEQQTPHINGI